jgi:hypothetical protein
MVLMSDRSNNVKNVPWHGKHSAVLSAAPDLEGNRHGADIGKHETTPCSSVELECRGITAIRFALVSLADCNGQRA